MHRAEMTAHPEGGPVRCAKVRDAGTPSPGICWGRDDPPISPPREATMSIFSSRIPRLASALGLTLLGVAGPNVTAAGSEGSFLTLICSGEESRLRAGDTLSIRWAGRNVPDGARVTLAVEKLATRHRLTPFATALPPSGALVWRIPVPEHSGRPCVQDLTGGCVGDMNPNTRYAVTALLWRPRPGGLPPIVIARGNCRPFLLVDQDI